MKRIAKAEHTHEKHGFATASRRRGPRCKGKAKLSVESQRQSLEEPGEGITWLTTAKQRQSTAKPRFAGARRGNALNGYGNARLRIEMRGNSNAVQ